MPAVDEASFPQHGAVPSPPDRSSALGELFACSAEALSEALDVEWAEFALLTANGEVDLFSAADRTTRPMGPGSFVRSRAMRADWSARSWPLETGPTLMTDPGGALDPAYAADRRLLLAGARALAIAPLSGPFGPRGLMVAAISSDSASEAGFAMFRATAHLLSLAAERERAWSIEEQRHYRRVRLEAALPAIAGSLDVRKVFVEVSGLIQEVIPHDVLAFALLLPDRSGVRVQAATHRGVLELPVYRFSTEQDALDANWQFLLAYDLVPLEAGAIRARISPRAAPEVVEVVTRPGPEWMRFIAQAQVRSILRVPIRSKGSPIGGLAFMSRAPDAYDAEDGLVASRVADQLALALAHQELAEEERRIAQAEERARFLEQRVNQLSCELERFSAHRAIGQSASWKGALAEAAQVAATGATVLITGESGTGKEVIARTIHRGSNRSSGPFVALNCAALPEQLMESELFGHERGAFTGASEARNGRIEQATGGVLFLDEVGEMSPTVQAKFLRFLQEREYQRVGGSKVLKADVRIVAATNRDPRAGIAKGEFREDLYYRLSVFEIHLPPLRQRPEDILVLAEAFLEEIGRGIGRPAAGLSESARERLLSHTWPGNVRELRNAIERAVILCHGGLVASEHLPLSVSKATADRSLASAAASKSGELPTEGLPLQQVERELLVKAMAKANHNKSQAAKLLGLSRGQIYSLLRKHGLTDARR